MKSKTIRLLLCFAGLAAALAFGFVPLAHAAEVAPAAAVAAPAVAVTAPFYTSADFWSVVFGVVAGIVAIVKNSALSAHQKINEALVLSIEEVTKLPGVAEAEQKIKTLIQAKATALGVQPLLHRIVQDLTEPAAQP
jgi:hypothetical protein